MSDGERWDEFVGVTAMSLLQDILRKVSENDPVQGKWPVSQNEICTLWTDASSLALGVVLEEDGDKIEDAAWLRKKDDTAHINLAELDAVVKGLNLAIKWNCDPFKLLRNT